MENKMKKLLVLLLFVTSACVQATDGINIKPCADGTSPVKSVSSDGSYYVYHCTIPLMEPTDRIDYSWYPKSELVNLTIPDNFEFIQPTKIKYHMATGEYQRYAENWWGGQKRFDELNCPKRLKEFDMIPNGQPVSITNHTKELMERCVVNIATMTHLNFPMMIENMSDIILHHATHRNVNSIPFRDDVNPTQYVKYKVMGITMEYYAIFKDLMPLTPEEHAIITDYFDEIAMGNIFHTMQFRRQCDVNNPTSWLHLPDDQSPVNGCAGGYASRLAIASVAYALSTNNDKVFERAKMNITYFLGTFDDNGIHVVSATRGGRAYGYHTDITQYLGYLTEVFATIDYDFLQHKMPRSGITVKQVMDKHWEIINDQSLLGVYAYTNKGIMPSIASSNMFLWENAKKLSTEQVIPMFQEKPWQQIAMANQRYLSEYRDETTTFLGKQINLKDVAFSKSKGAGNWRNLSFPVEYLYYMNNNIESGENNLLRALDNEKIKTLDAEKIKTLNEQSDMNAQNIINLILSNESK